MRHFKTMGASTIIVALLLITLASQAWCVAIKSNAERNVINELNDNDMKQSDVAAEQSDDANLRRNYALLLETMKDNPRNHHLFGFGFARQKSAFGRRRDYLSTRELLSRALHSRRKDGLDDQSSSVFHGKRGLSLAIKSNAKRDAAKESSDAMKRENEDAMQQSDDANLRRSYAMLLDNMLKDLPGTHPFRFRISRKKRDYLSARELLARALYERRRDGPDDQNTSIFHGKRSEDLMSDLLSDDEHIYHPGRKDMATVMRYLLNDLDTRGSYRK